MALDLNSAAVDGAEITTAATVTTEAVGKDPQSICYVAMQSDFDYGSSGTTVKVYLQTSLDGGAKWVDVACHAFTTSDSRKVSAVKKELARAEAVATDGSLSDDTELDGLFGDRWRVKYVSTGTYADTTLNVDLIFG